MSSNILNPIGDALFAYCKWVWSAWGKSEKVDFKSIFRNMNFKNKDEKYPQLIKHTEEEFYRVYEFSVPLGMSIKNFQDKEDVFAQALNVDKKDLIFKKRDYNVVIKARNSKLPNYEYDEDIHKARGFKIPIGVNLETLNLRYWDLADAANSHCYIAGGTRCGKSTLLRLIMCFLVKKSCGDILLDLLNEKRVDLIEFKDCKNVVNYTEDPNEGVSILDDVIEEMERRYVLFSKYKGVKNIWDYRNKVQKMPVRIVVIEEMSSYVNDTEFHARLAKIASRGAGAGVLILCTAQLPNMKVMPSLTKQNINTTIGGKCKDSIRSEIIIEDGDLHKLRGKGHMKIFDSYDYGTEIQVLYIDDDKVDEIAQANLKRSKKEAK